MASSAHSFSAGEFNAVMLMINVGSPWSEAGPGTKFEDWSEQQFHNKAPNLEMGNSDRQLESVSGLSNRVGVNGLMNPLKGLSEAARLQFSGRQPLGGSTVKVVLRPVRANSRDCAIVLQEVGDKLWGSSQLPGCTSRLLVGTILCASIEAACLRSSQNCVEAIETLDNVLGLK
jgi:hypothetical protein